MFSKFKNIYKKNPRIKYKNQSIPSYIPNKTLIKLYKYNTSKYYVWQYHKIIIWGSSFLKPNWNWKDIIIAKKQFYIHPISGKKITNIKSLRHKLFKKKYINKIPINNKLKFKNNNNIKYKKLYNNDFYNINILLNNYKKFYPYYDNFKTINHINSYYSFKNIGYYILNLSLLKQNIKPIYSIKFPYIISYYIYFNPKWINLYPISNFILINKNLNILDFKINNKKYFNDYIPLWKNNKFFNPNIQPTNKKKYLALPNLLYNNNNLLPYYKELYILINYLKFNPFYTKKILKNINKSDCLNYIKKDYYLEIFSNIKPHYTSLYKHYIINI